MNVLVLTHLDATNYSIAQIVREMIARGHRVEAYGRFTDEHNIKMFEDLIEVHQLSELTDDHINEFDFIFSAIDVIDRVRNIKKYIFCYNFLFCGNLIADCGDFMFTQCDNRMLEYSEECATMAIGNPKFTEMVTDKKSSHKQFLFIDSGHYPFGIEGRVIIANILLNIARTYTDYRLVIKPRFLVGDKNVTHRNDDHIYNVIEREANGNIPENLIMLQEHLDMNQLIDASDLVLCLYTTAYIDVILRNKKLIIIDGLPSEETFDQRYETIWKKQRSVLADSGCMCHYSQVMNHMPNGFCATDESINRVVKYKGDAARRGVSAMEYVWDEYLRKGLFPSIKNHIFENVNVKLEVDPELNWERIITKRYKNKLRYRSRYIDYVSADVAKKPFMKMIDELEDRGLISPYTINETIRLVDYYKNELWIKNKEALWDDAINQSSVVQALFENHKYDELKQIEEKDIECQSQFYYFMGRVMCDEKKYDKAISFFKDFLKASREKPYAQFWVDQTSKQVSGEYFMGYAYYMLKEYEEAYRRFEICEELTDNCHNMAAKHMKEIEQIWSSTGHTAG
ncbi:MAG: hypothetical protein MJ123_01045 [Lachnospiraceae bacterium]|nr:hypothetical protein [Lachnospiraceae bacterium]